MGFSGLEESGAGRGRAFCQVDDGEKIDGLELRSMAGGPQMRPRFEIRREEARRASGFDGISVDCKHDRVGLVRSGGAMRYFFQPSSYMAAVSFRPAR